MASQSRIPYSENGKNGTCIVSEQKNLSSGDKEMKSNMDR
jgi:hypothetical protein